MNPAAVAGGAWSANGHLGIGNLAMAWYQPITAVSKSRSGMSNHPAMLETGLTNLLLACF